MNVMTRAWVSTLLAFAPMSAMAQGDPHSVTTPGLTLEAATARALAGSLSLQISQADALAARGRRLQAGVRPNPVLALDAENLAASRRAEVTVRGTQRLELGGKRSARAGFADFDVLAARSAAAAESLVVRAETLRLYAEAQASAAATGIARQSVRIAEELAEAVARKVTAGAVSPAEAARASVELANARLEMSEAVSEAALAEARLSSLWGAATLSGAALAPIPEQLPAPAQATLSADAPTSPAIAAIEARVGGAERNLRLQKALGTPDLEVAAGVRSGPDGDQPSYVAGVSIPLPLFDRNAGHVATAAAELTRARAELDRALRLRALEIAEGRGALERARARREALHREVLPAAHRAYEEVLAGYLRGRFDYVDVLDARRTMIAASRAELEAYVDHAAAMARLEIALGGTASLLDRKDGRP